MTKTNAAVAEDQDVPETSAAHIGPLVNLTRAKIKRMSVEQIMAHVLKEFDVKMDPEKMSKDEMIGYLIALQDGRAESVRTDKLAAEGKLKEDTRATKNLENAPRIRIILHQQEGPIGQEPVAVSVNGRAITIPRNIPVDVPEPYLGALDDAKERRYRQENKDGKIVTVEYEVPRYTYTLVR